MSGVSEERSSQISKTKTVENHKVHSNKDATSGSQLWTDGLICAFEFIRATKKTVKNHTHSDEVTEPTPRRSRRSPLLESEPLVELEGPQAGSSNVDGQKSQLDKMHSAERFDGICWVPIGWARISELVRTVQADEEWANQHFEFVDGEDDITVADLAAPYWERPVGPTWWCHLCAGHPNVEAWLNSAQWLHPAIRTALRDESRLISDKMKHLLYEVCGLVVLFK